MGSELPKQSAYPLENDGPRILGAVLGITIFAVLTMGARLWVRVKMIRNVGWDVRSPRRPPLGHNTDSLRITACHLQQHW
jgi:hypothetical protein